MSNLGSSYATRRTDRPAFTLVELLMVLVILGIAAAIVVPMTGKTADIDASAAARQLSADLAFAQNYAIAHQGRVQVSFNAASGSYTLALLPSGGGAAVTLLNPLTRKPYVVSLAGGALSGVRLSSATTIVFDSLGGVEQPGDVTLTCGDVARIVRVAPITGKVTIE